MDLWSERRHEYDDSFESSATTEHEDMMELTANISHLLSPLENGSFFTVHYLCNENAPYPSITLSRATWPAVCLLYTLPSSVACYYREDEGKSFKVSLAEGCVVHSSPSSQPHSRSMSSNSLEYSQSSNRENSADLGMGSEAIVTNEESVGNEKETMKLPPTNKEKSSKCCD